MAFQVFAFLNILYVLIRAIYFFYLNKDEKKALKGINTRQLPLMKEVLQPEYLTLLERYVILLNLLMYPNKTINNSTSANYYCVFTSLT